MNDVSQITKKRTNVTNTTPRRPELQKVEYREHARCSALQHRVDEECKPTRQSSTQCQRVAVPQPEQRVCLDSSMHLRLVVDGRPQKRLYVTVVVRRHAPRSGYVARFGDERHSLRRNAWGNVTWVIKGFKEKIEVGFLKNKLSRIE